MISEKHVQAILMELNIAFKQKHYFGPPKPEILKGQGLKTDSSWMPPAPSFPQRLERNIPAGRGYRSW